MILEKKCWYALLIKFLTFDSQIKNFDLFKNLSTQCRKSVVIMGSDYEKIKTMETVSVGGFNYIIVFSSNSDAIFMTH